MNTDLITDHLDLWTSAVTYNRGEPELTGIAKLRELILELAVRGKLVPQDPEDEPASVLLERIEEEKERLYKEGKIKKPKKLPIISEKEKAVGFPNNWMVSRLGELVEVIRGISFPASEKSSVPQPGRVPCLRTINVQKEIEWEDLLYIKRELVKREDQFARKDDIVMSMANSKELVGKVAILKHEPENPVTFGGFFGGFAAYRVKRALYDGRP